MAINKNSIGYTVGFAAGLVILCGTILALLSSNLKEKQNANVANEKRQFILFSAGYSSMEELKALEQSEVEAIYNEKIESAVYDFNGALIEGKEAFDIDIVKEFKATKNSPKDRKYPVFFYKVSETEKKSVIPMAGNGLWGPVWGYVALDNAQENITGVVFDHKSETPGLGAKITEKWFQEKFVGKKIMNGDKYMGIKIVKGGLKNPNHEVDAIAGATITSNGVSAMTKKAFLPYMKAWGKVK